MTSCAGSCLSPIQTQFMRSVVVPFFLLKCNSIWQQVVLRGSISYNTEFQRPLQYNLELRHLPDNYTFMVMEDAMYSVQGFEVKMERKLLPSLTKFYIPTQLLVALSWLAFFVPPEVISGRMVLLITILLMLTNIGSPAIVPFSVFSLYICRHFSWVWQSTLCSFYSSPHLATGMPNSDYCQHCSVCLCPLHHGKRGKGEGKWWAGPSSFPPIFTRRIHSGHWSVRVIKCWPNCKTCCFSFSQEPSCTR